jgi:hypothetical protein
MTCAAAVRAVANVAADDDSTPADTIVWGSGKDIPSYWLVKYYFPYLALLQSCPKATDDET